MTALSVLQFVSACCWLNGFRGRGLVPGGRILGCLGIGAGFGLLAWIDAIPPGRSLLLGIVTAGGVSGWALAGWGKYFSAITGRDDPAEHEVRWIDWIGYRLLPPATGRNRLRGTICMGLRGLYLYPLFVALALLVTPWALLIGLGGALQGACYGLVGRFPESPLSVACAELLFGTVIGLLLAATLA